MLEGEGRAVGEADDGDVHVLDPRRETSRPGGPSGGRSSKLTRRSPARWPAHRAGGGQPFGQRRLAARDRLGETSSMRGPGAGEQACIAAPTRSGVISGALRSKLSSTVCGGGDHRFIVDGVDQLLGADLRLDGRLALHGGVTEVRMLLSSRSISAALGGARSASPMIAKASVSAAAPVSRGRRATAEVVSAMLRVRDVSTRRR
jgi:hypothetical protein